MVYILKVNKYDWAHTVHKGLFASVSDDKNKFEDINEVLRNWIRT